MKPQNIIATVYDRKGRVLAVGKNSYVKTHPKQYELAKRAGEPKKVYLHAEISAIIKAQKQGKPFKIKIERFSKDGNLLSSEPCPICKLAIKEAGISFVEYSI